MKAGKYFIIALVVIIIDQITKLIVKLNMELGEEIPIIGDLFKIHFIENKGAAFGLTVGHLLSAVGISVTPETSKLILSLFSIVAVIAIGYVLYKMASHRSPLPLFVALIFGGAMGNIIDRTFYGVFFESINQYEGGLFHGRVVDMFYFDIWRGYLPNWIPFAGGTWYSLWPIFNVADSAISVGIVVILFFQGKFFIMDEKAKEAELAALKSESAKISDKVAIGSQLDVTPDEAISSKSEIDMPNSNNGLSESFSNTNKGVASTLMKSTEDELKENGLKANPSEKEADGKDSHKKNSPNEVSQAEKGSSDS